MTTLHDLRERARIGSLQHGNCRECNGPRYGVFSKARQETVYFMLCEEHMHFLAWGAAKRVEEEVEGVCWRCHGSGEHPGGPRPRSACSSCNCQVLGCERNQKATSLFCEGHKCDVLVCDNQKFEGRSSCQEHLVPKSKSSDGWFRCASDNTRCFQGAKSGDQCGQKAVLCRNDGNKTIYACEDHSHTRFFE